MRANPAILKRVLSGATLLFACAGAHVDASEIKGLQLIAGATGTRAEIALDTPGEFKVISLSGPDRLVIDLPASSLVPGVAVPAGAGVVTAVRTGKPVPGTARIVFDLAQTVTAIKPRIEQTATGPRLVVEWPGDGVPARIPAQAVAATASLDSTAAAARMLAPVTPPDVTPADTAAASSEATSRLISQIAANANATGAGNSALVTTAASVPTTVATGVPAPVRAPAPGPTPAAAPPPVKTLQQVMQGQGMRPLVIAIDPGHGGQDPGAVGKNGTREKDVVLAISKELARQINATPGLKAYMTREHDVFIPLNKRAALARTAKADMFISIHADAAENRGADGSSVYVLSLRGASSQRARWLADKENSADLIGGVSFAKTNNTLASVLLDLTQSGHMKASEDAAGQILSGLKRVGNIHKPNIERANFAVLRTSDMPAMLVETAFISNPAEEARLKDPAFQRKLAGAVLDGVNTFFTRQPPPGTMYAARAAAAESASASLTAAGSP